MDNEPRPADCGPGKTFILELAESFCDPGDELLAGMEASLSRKLNGSQVIILPPGMKFTQAHATPYYVRERVGDVEREVGFGAKWELDEYLAKLDAHLPPSPQPPPGPDHVVPADPSRG